MGLLRYSWVYLWVEAHYMQYDVPSEQTVLNELYKKQVQLYSCCCFCFLHINRSGLNHTPSNIRGCQSGTWSQRGTKVNGSRHGDNPLLRPTRIQIATKRYASLQAMAPTNVKTDHQTSLLHIESNLDRLGILSPTHGQRSQQQSGQITLQPVLINKSKFL